MADTGVWRMWESAYFQQTVWPPFKKKYPIDADKVERTAKGTPTTSPGSAFAKGIWEEMRKHPLLPNPITSWGIYDKPVVMLHNSRGGVEYQEEQVKYFGSAALDMNNPNSWDNYITRAKSVGLKTFPWLHCHNYDDITTLINAIRAQGLWTGGLNLEDLVTEGMSVPYIANMIDSRLGPDSILCIPTLGWVQNLDWSALSRHVFLLEFFLNDPPKNGDWEMDPVELCKQLAEHASAYGVRKMAFLCGIYPPPADNPYGKVVSADEYQAIIKEAGERFGGIYLGDNNGSNYAQWA